MNTAILVVSASGGSIESATTALNKAIAERLGEAQRDAKDKAQVGAWAIASQQTNLAVLPGTVNPNGSPGLARQVMLSCTIVLQDTDSLAGRLTLPPPEKSRET